MSATRARIRAWLTGAIDSDGIDDVLLATGEALANAFEHGEPPVHLEMRWTETRQLSIAISDGGIWTMSVLRSQRGRGVPIMTTLMDKFTVDTTSGGTIVRMNRNFGR